MIRINSAKYLPALLLIMAAGIINAGGQTKSPTASESISTGTEAAQIVKNLFEAFNRHDAEGLGALYAAEVFADSPDYPQPKRTAAEVRAYYGEMFRQTPDIRDEVTNMTICGNRVFVEFISTGTTENPAKDLPPTVKGKSFKLKIATFLEIKDGKIVRDVSYYDQLSILKQLGLAPE